MAGFGGIMKWLFPVLAFFVIWKFLLPMVGLNPTTSMVLALVFTLGATLLLGKFFPMFRLPVPMLSKLNTLILAAMVAGPLIAGGILSIPSGTTTTPYIPGQVPGSGVSSGACSVNPELLGKAATINLNAWDMEADSPYASAVDLTTSCWVYKNGVDAKNYVTTTTDTSDGNLSNKFAVGDMIYIFCGGTTYYTDPYSACVDNEAFSVNLETHTAAATTELLITGYDNTGGTALTAGITNKADYNLTLGANQEDTIYLKLKTNVADNALMFGGWAVAKFYNITTVEPKSTDGRIYTQGITPTAFESQVVSTASTAENTITKDWTPYKLSAPLLIREWESIKDQFTIEASSSDPLPHTENSTSFNGFAICAFDVQYARGSDGKVYEDYYAHTTAESNVGITETLTSPIGKDNCVLISAN